MVDQSEAAITRLVATIKQQEQQAGEVLHRLNEFVLLFYSEIERAVYALMEKGVGIARNVKIQEQTKGTKSLSFEWDNTKIILSPTPRAAFPSSTFRVPLPKELAGRVVVFYQPMGRPDNADPIGELYVFPNGSWCAYGIFGLHKDDSFDQTKLGSLAFELLKSLSAITSEHRTLKESKFDPTTQSQINPIGFALSDKH